MVFGADHVYRMDPEQMVQQHIESGAGVTVAGIRVPRSEAFAFGCIDSDESGRIAQFLEKPAHPPGTPDDPNMTFASMGNYVFTTKVLVDAIRADSENADSDHDMGGDIIPALVEAGEAAVYDFKDNIVPGATDRDRGYWRDVGTLDAFYDAHMDLVSVTRCSTSTTVGGRSAVRRRTAAGQVRAGRSRAGVGGRGRAASCRRRPCATRCSAPT